MNELQSDRSPEENPKGSSGKRRSLLLVVLLLLLLSVTAGAAILYFSPSEEPAEEPERPFLPPDTLPEAEERAVPHDGEEDADRTDSSGAVGSVNVTYTDLVTVSLEDGEARLNFSNPKRSNQSMVLDLLIQDVLILRSGALQPGTTLESLPLLDYAQLAPGGYEGLFRVAFYDPDTGKKSVMNAEIPVQVKVVERFEEEDHG